MILKNEKHFFFKSQPLVKNIVPIVVHTRNNCIIFLKRLIFFLPLLTGALDTSTIHIVPKNKLNEGSNGTPVMKKVPMKVLNQPFETTFRLQVGQFRLLLLGPKVVRPKCQCQKIHIFSQLHLVSMGNPHFTVHVVQIRMSR